MKIFNKDSPCFTIKQQPTLLNFQIDIEGYEFSDGGFTDWIKSGALTHVKQLAIELHINHEENNER